MFALFPTENHFFVLSNVVSNICMDGCMHASECTANAPIISEILQQSALSKEMKDRKRTLWSFCIYVFPLKLQLKTSFRRSYCSRFVLLACVRLKCVIQNQKGAKGPYMLSAKVKSNNNNNDWTHCHKAFIFVCYSRFIASSSTPFFLFILRVVFFAHRFAPCSPFFILCLPGLPGMWEKQRVSHACMYLYMRFSLSLDCVLLLLSMNAVFSLHLLCLCVCLCMFEIFNFI